MYTVGMWKNFGAPELVVFGLPPHVAGHILNDIREKIREGMVLHPGKKYDNIAEGYDTTFVEIKEEDDIFNFARLYYKKHGTPDDLKFPRMQLVWPDEFNTFPWEEGHNEAMKKTQPLFGKP
jgi:hypothetical protein